MLKRRLAICLSLCSVRCLCSLSNSHKFCFFSACMCVCVSALTSADLSSDVLALTVITLTVFAMNTTVPRWVASTLSAPALTYKNKHTHTKKKKQRRFSHIWAGFHGRIWFLIAAQCLRSAWVFPHPIQAVGQEHDLHSFRSSITDF